MRKIVIIVCFVVLTGVCENVWGAAEHPVVSFLGVSELTRNLFDGYVRCGSLIKSLVPNEDTPMLRAIKVVGAYSLNIAEKVHQVKDFLDGLVDTMGEDFSAECFLANPTLKLSPQKSCEILAVLRKDLENWLEKHKIFLEK